MLKEVTMAKDELNKILYLAGQKPLYESKTNIISKSFSERLNESLEDNCNHLYDCCDCGCSNGEMGCGCSGCFSCNACDKCLEDDSENCYLIKNEKIVESSDKKESMYDFIKRQYKIALKKGNATAAYYYAELNDKLKNDNLLAMSSYEIFINSWAGQEWFKKKKKIITDFAKDHKLKVEEPLK
jgi:hypothetical protein